MKTLALYCPHFTLRLHSGRRAIQPADVFDFRAQTRNNPPRITAATSKQVLDAVFRKYLRTRVTVRTDVETSGAEDYLAAMRKAGKLFLRYSTWQPDHSQPLVKIRSLTSFLLENVMLHMPTILVRSVWQSFPETNSY